VHSHRPYIYWIELAAAENTLFAFEPTSLIVPATSAIHLFVEVEVEVVEGLLRVAELGLLFPPLQQALAAASQFVRDQAEITSVIT